MVPKLLIKRKLSSNIGIQNFKRPKILALLESLEFDRERVYNFISQNFVSDSKALRFLQYLVKIHILSLLIGTFSCKTYEDIMLSNDERL